MPWCFRCLAVGLLWALAVGGLQAHDERGGDLVSVTTPPAPEPPAAAEPAAEVVELAPVMSVSQPHAGGPVGWDVAAESRVSREATSEQPKPGDPEWVRTFPDDNAPDGTTTGAGKSNRWAPKPGDPEAARRWPEDAAAPESGGLASREGKRKAPDADHPRFALGEGLDDEAFDLSALDPLAEFKPEPDSAALAKAAEATPKTAASKDAKRKPKQDGKGKNTAREPQSAEEEQAQLDAKIAKIKQQQAELEAQRAMLKAEETAAAEKQDSEKEGEVVRSRSKRGTQAIQALQDDRPVARITGQVYDGETRLLLPARVKIVDSSDTAAGSALPDVGFWCEGSFTVPVAPGKVRIEIRAGRFRRMYLKDVLAEPGQPLAIDAMLVRPADLNFEKDGWHCADLNFALRARRGETPLWTGDAPGFADAVLAARAEGVQVLGLAMPWAPEDEARPATESIAALNSSARGLTLLPVFPGPQHPFCGSGLGIGMQEWKDVPRQLSDPHSPLHPHFDELRRAGGLAVFTELTGRRAVDPRKAVLPLFPRLGQQGLFTPKDATALLFAPAELPFATVAGPAYDALALDGSDAALAIWFNLLNEGYAIPAIGAGGGSLEAGGVPEGQTFVKLDGPPERENVLQACRAGRSFVSFGGPAVFASLAERDKGPGDRLAADGRTWNLRIRAYASLQPGTSLARIEVIRNGKVIRTELCEEGMAALHNFNVPVAEREDAWYCVRAVERVEVQGQPKTTRFAITNPVYFDTPGRTMPQPARARLTGILRKPGGTPTAGKVTILEPGREPAEVAVGADGRYSVSFLAAGALIFEADGCEPASRRAFDNPQTLKALGQVLAERDGPAREQLARSALLGYWRLILSDWHEDITLQAIKLSK